MGSLGRCVPDTVDPDAHTRCIISPWISAEAYQTTDLVIHADQRRGVERDIFARDIFLRTQSVARLHQIDSSGSISISLINTFFAIACPVFVAASPPRAVSL